MAERINLAQLRELDAEAALKLLGYDGFKPRALTPDGNEYPHDLAAARQYVRVTADALLALLDAVEAAHELRYIFECRCAAAYTGRGLHGPDCKHEESGDLREALARFDFGDQP